MWANFAASFAEFLGEQRRFFFELSLLGFEGNLFSTSASSSDCAKTVLPFFDYLLQGSSIWLAKFLVLTFIVAVMSCM